MLPTPPPLTAKPNTLRMRWAWLWVIGLLILVACDFSTPTAQRDAVVSRSWLDDSSANLSAVQALAGRWMPFSGTLSRGFTASVTWARLRIDPAAAGPPSSPTDQRLVLRIMPAILDEVTVYRADDGGWQPIAVVGDRHPSRGPQQGLLHHAVTFTQVDAPFEVLLRLQSNSNHSLHVVAQRWDAARDTVSRQENLVTAYLVFTLMVMMWVAADWWFRRDAVEVLFLAHQATAVLLTFTIMGVLRLHGPLWLASAGDLISSMAIALSTAITIRFHAELLARLGAKAMGPRLMSALSIPPLLAVALIALDWVTAGLMLTHLSILMALFMSIVTAWTIGSGRPLLVGGRINWHRVQLLLIHGVMAMVILPSTLRVLGFMSAGPWSFAGYAVYGFTSTVLLGILLVMGTRQDYRRKQIAKRMLHEAQQRSASQRALIAEQSDLMAMLTHELKTPLSVLNLSMSKHVNEPLIRQRVQRAINNMREVIDRCEQSIKADDAALKPSTPSSLGLVSVQELVQAVAEVQLERDRLNIVTAVDLPTCKSDAQMLHVVIGNLVENALKYSPGGSMVRISLTSVLANNLPGVALCVFNRVGVAGRPDPKHLFEKYHRGARARHLSGCGLGLHLSHRLSLYLGANLTLCDADLDHVCFRLWIPC